jgi:hypothetical protein
LVSLRVVAVLVLWAVSHASVADLIKLEISGPVIAAAGTHWVGPGPTPQSFAGTITVDSLDFASQELHFFEPDPGVGPRLDSYRFDGVRVDSISIAADGSELWSEPDGLTLTFGGDNPSAHGLGGYFAGTGGENAVGQSVSLSYDTFPGLTEAQATAGGDVLRNVLLNTQPFPPGTYQIKGEWGEIAGPLIMQVAAIPEPSTQWALLIGLAALVLGVSRIPRAAASEPHACLLNESGFPRYQSSDRPAARRRRVGKQAAWTDNDTANGGAVLARREAAAARTATCAEQRVQHDLQCHDG